jgi:hypothetical protein
MVISKEHGLSNIPRLYLITFGFFLDYELSVFSKINHTLITSLQLSFKEPTWFFSA